MTVNVSPKNSAGYRAINRTTNSHKTLASRKRRAGVYAGLSAAVMAAAWSLAPTASAANLTWDASGTNPTAPTDGSGTWDATSFANWSNGTTDNLWVNANNDTAVIGANNGPAGTITLGTGAGITVGGMVFNPAGSGNYIIIGDTLTLAGATPTITMNTGATINSVVAGTTGLTLAGTGALTLGGIDTYTGITQLNTGTLSLATGGSLSSATINVASPATFNIQTGTTLAATTALTDTGIVNFNSAAATIATLNGSGALNLNGTALTISGGGTFTGTIANGTNPGSVVVSGGTLNLSGTNTFSGGLSLTGSPAIVVAKSTQALGSLSNTITMNNGGGTTLDLATDTSIAAYNVSVPLNATILSDKATAASAGITHTLGTLTIGQATLTVNAGANATSGTPTVTFGSTNIVLPAAPDFFPGTAALSLGSVTSTNIGFTIDGTNTGNNTLGPINIGTGQVVKSGASTWTIVGTGNYTGGTAVNGGVLAITSDAAINNGSGGITFGGGTLQFNNYTSNLSFSGNTNLALGAATGAASTLTGTISGSRIFTYNGPGTLILAGTNTFSGSGEPDNFVTAGTLVAATDSALGVVTNHSGLAFSTTTAAPTAPVVDFTSANPAIGYIRTQFTAAGVTTLGTGNGSIVLGNATAGTPTTLTLGGWNNNFTQVYSGTISDVSGTNSAATGSILKTDTAGQTASLQTLSGNVILGGSLTVNSGTLNLSGASNSFGGLVKVTAGTLNMSGASNNIGGTVTVAGGSLIVGSGAAITGTHALSLGGGNLSTDTLNFSSTRSTAGSVSFTGTTINTDANILITNGTLGSGNSLNLGAFTRNVGGMLSFGDRSSTNGIPTAGAITTTTANSNFTGGSQTILGGWAFVPNGSTDANWAVSASNGTTPGNITALPTASYSAVSGSALLSTLGTKDVLVAGGLTADTTIASNLTINSLKTTGGTTFALSNSAVFTIANGGIIFANSGNAANFNGTGSITSGNGQDLMVICSSNAAGPSINFNIPITDNGSTPIGFSTDANKGTMTINFNVANTYSGDTNLNAPTNGDHGNLVLQNANALQNSTLNYNSNGNCLVFFGTSGTPLTSANFGGLKGTQNLIVQNSSSGAATVALSVGSNNQNTTYSGVISSVGAGVLTFNKVGTGKLTLSNTSTYTGPTNINGGSLILSNATSSSPLASSAITLGSSSTTLDASGLLNGTMNVIAGQNVGGLGTIKGNLSTSLATGAITAGTSSTIGTLTLNNNLSVTGGLLNFYLNTVSGLNSQINDLAGTTTLNPASFNLYNLGTTTAASIPGTYKLINFGSSSINLAGLQMANTHIGSTYSFSTTTDPGWLDLTIANAVTLTWTGATNGNWDMGTTNWASGSTGAIYASDTGASPIFNDNSAISPFGPITNNNVNITAPSGVAPQGGVVFNNNVVNYTIGGNGINGVGVTITMNGTANVTLNNSNAFTGAVKINSGSITAANSNALGSTFGVQVASGAALQLQGGITIGNSPINIAGAGVTAAPAGAIDNTSGTNSYGGVITLVADATIGSDSGTLTLAGSPAVTGTGQNLTLAGAGSGVVAGAISSGVNNLNKTGTGTWTINSQASYTGGTNITNGKITLAPTSTNLLPTGTVLTLGSGSTGGMLVLGDGSGGGNSGANQTVAGLATSGTALASDVINQGGFLTSGGGHGSPTLIYDGYPTLTVNVASGVTQTFAGTLGDNGNGTFNNYFDLTKIGAGTQILSGSNNLSGYVTIAAGTLGLGSANALPNAYAIRFQGGTLQFSAANTTDLSSTISPISGAPVLDTTVNNEPFSFDTNGQTVTFNGTLASAGVPTLTKMGAGYLILGNTSVFAGTGNVTINGGVLQTSNLLPNSNLITINQTGSNPNAVWQVVGGGTITRAAGGAAGNINVGGNAGFAAKTGALTVNLGSGAQLTWSSGFGGSGGAALVFGTPTADSQVIFQNPLSLGTNDTFAKTVFVDKGVGGDSAIMTGAITNGANTGGNGPASGLDKTGQGILTLNNPASSFSGYMAVTDGTLIAGGGVPAPGNAGPFGVGTGPTNVPSATFNQILLGGGGQGGGITASVAGNAPTLYIGGAFTVARPITVANVAGVTYTLGGNTDSLATYSGLITANSNFQVTQVANTGGNSLNITGGITSGNAGTKNVTFANVGPVNVSGTAISDGGGGKIALVDNGTGTVALSGPNTYTGGTTVNVGTLTGTGASPLGGTTGPLAVNNPNLGAGTAVTLNLSTTAATTTGSLSGTIATPSSGTNTATINNGGQLLAVNQTTAGTFAGSINGGGGLTVGALSTNTLTLSGSNSYSGNTTIAAGTLAISGTGSISNSPHINLNGGSLNVSGVSSPPFTVGASQTLMGQGTVIGAVNVLGTIQTGQTNNIGGKTAAVLTLGTGSTLAGSTLMDLTAINASDEITVGAGLLNFGGTVTVTNPNTIAFAAGQAYDLFGFGSDSGSFSNLPVGSSVAPASLPTLGSGLAWNTSTVYSNGIISIISTGPANLFFTGSAGNGNWDTASTTNFTTTGSDVVAFHASDNVTFDNTHNTTQFNVAVASGGVVPTAMTVTGTTPYTFSGGNIGSASTTSLTVASSASMTFDRGAGSRVTLELGSLSNSGLIDLKNNTMLLHNADSTVAATVRTELQSGFNGGAWNGATGIKSSSAAGSSLYTLGELLSGSDLTVAYTLYGDANLSGMVDGTDYSIIDTNNGLTSGGTWQTGDFNYDGTVDGSDYSLIDNAFNTQTGANAVAAAQIAVNTSEIAGGSAAVPEPASLGLLAIGAIGLMSRRRRRA